MYFEIHLTVKQGDILQFREHCEEIGVKPILIETENNQAFGMQMMTSSSNHAYSFHEILNKQKSELIERGYEVVREKVEIKPEGFKHNNHRYYESHLRLKLAKNFDRKIVEEFCRKYDLHLSKNLFKITKDFNYQMMTYRKNKMDEFIFKTRINQFKKKLEKLNIECDKIEIEECIHDSNILIDYQWLSKR